MPTTAHHKVVIVGGGTAGISVAARLVRDVDDVAVIEPSDKHHYQPLWTLVGAGCSAIAKSERAESSVMPKKATWIKDAADSFDPDNNAVHTTGGQTIGYDVLIVCPGIQLDWDKIPGVTDTLGRNGVSSNYRPDLAPKTWEFIHSTTSGTALFTMPSGPIKMFDIPVIADELDKVVADYGMNVHFEAELESVDADGKEAAFKGMNEGGDGFSLPYDVMHVVPHQSAPDWVKSSPLAGGDPNENYGGYTSCPITTSTHTMLLAEFDYTMEPTPSIPVINTLKPRRDMWFLKKYGLPALYWNLMLTGRA